MKRAVIIRWNFFPRGWLFAGLMCWSLSSSAQGLYNASSVFLNGASLYVDGNISNEGLIVNNGYAGFTHDWSSPGKYDGAGVLDAHGEGPQKIAHYNQKVFALVINGWGTKYIEGKITITGKVDFENGIVEVSPSDQLLVKEHAVISGGSEGSYFDGALTVEGKGYKYFPLGKSGTFAPIEFLDADGKDAVYSVEVFDDAPLVSVENVVVKNTYYWQRSDLAGTFEGSAVAVTYDPLLFPDPKKVTMLEGADWDSPLQMVPDLHQAAHTNKLITDTHITGPLILLGEIADNWTKADFYLSTALSPDASRAENRKVKIFGQRLSADGFHLTVFNRLGAVVFETRSLDQMTDNGWDGRSTNGSVLTTGAYPYKLKGVDKAGGIFEKSGIITILY